MGLSAGYNPLIAFRADATASIGSGHVMRCLTLATQLASRNARIVFVTREMPTYLTERIRASGHRHITIRVEASADGERADADATRSAITELGETPKWIVVDHYGLGVGWESIMRGGGSFVLAIDDLANRPHNADVLLDQNLVVSMETRYSGLLAKSTLQLLGPRYAMLQPDYATARKDITRGHGSPRALVYFGAADKTLTRMAAEACALVAAQGAAIDIVLDEENRQFPALARTAAENPAIRLHKPVQTLAHLMAQADLFIGAGGATSWERLCLGLPSIVVTMADNQLPIAAELDRRGFAEWVGTSADITADRLADAMIRAFSRRFPSDLADTMMRLVDGRGVERVCDVLHLGRDTSLACRKVEVSDSDMLLGWANDPGTRRFAFQQHEIEPAEHAAWFAKRLGNPSAAFFIVETPSGTPVGQVRFERQDDATWMVSYLLAPLFRSRGLGRPLLEAGLDALGTHQPDAIAVGLVKPDNTASVRVFRGLAFEEALDRNREALVFRRHVRRR